MYLTLNLTQVCSWVLDVYVCVMYIYFSAGKARWTNWVDAELYRVYSHFQNAFNFHWHFMAVKTFTISMMMSSNGNFPLNWPFVRGIYRPPVNSPHKGEWRGALMFSLICARINGWVNNHEAGDLRRHRTHYDVTVMLLNQPAWVLSVVRIMDMCLTYC